MIIQNLIVYQFTSFFKIFKEIEEELNFNIVEVEDANTLKNTISVLDNYIIISKKKKFKYY